MDIRYQHPLVNRFWSLPFTHQLWWRIEQSVARSQRERGLIPKEETDALMDSPGPEFDAGTTADIVALEIDLKHDVVAFLTYVRSWYGTPSSKWIHYGLTSSDLVDTAQAMRFKGVSVEANRLCVEVLHQLAGWESNTTPILGRTHGQPAEPMEVRVRAAHWADNLTRAMHDLLATCRKMQMCKIAGPTGTYAHNPPTVEYDVAQDLGLTNLGHGASQIVPRVLLSAWADAAARVAACCSKIATDIRLMNLMEEATIGRVATAVGSSSMAHKDNPILAEQINGMAQLAAGYASMLRPLDLWLERDISHSCVERVAVPDLWHVVLHTLSQTVELLKLTDVDVDQSMANLLKAGTAPFISKLTNEAIIWADNLDEARRRALEWKPDEVPMDTQWFMRHYPWEPHDLTGSQED